MFWSDEDIYILHRSKSTPFYLSAFAGFFVFQNIDILKYQNMLVFKYANSTKQN